VRPSPSCVLNHLQTFRHSRFPVSPAPSIICARLTKYHPGWGSLQRRKNIQSLKNLSRKRGHHVSKGPESAPHQRLTALPVPNRLRQVPPPANSRPRHTLPSSRRHPTRRLRRPLRPAQPKSLPTQIRSRRPCPTLESLPRPPAGPHLPAPRRRTRLHRQPTPPHPPRHRKTGIPRERRNGHHRRTPPDTRQRRNAPPNPLLRRSSATRRPVSQSTTVLPNPKLLRPICAKTLRLPPCQPLPNAGSARLRRTAHFFSAFAIAASASGAITAYPARFGCNPSSLNSRFRNPASSTVAEK